MLGFLLILAISVANAAENAYQTFGVKLPTNLMSTITAVYGDNLYVFGGVNQTSNGAFNSKFWKLDLSDIEFSDDNKNDITTVPDDSMWVDITDTVAKPDYGDSINGEFRCNGQCSVVIEQYLYIVGPYSSASTSQTADRTDIYRLDLSVDPPEFAAQDDFVSSIGYTTRDSRDACVTSANGKMYIISGTSGSILSLEARVYDSSTTPDTMSSIAPLNSGRFTAGCAPNAAEDEIYLAGGRGSVGNIAVPGVDTWTDDGSTGSWTDNANADDFDTGDGDPNSNEGRKEMKCFTNYQNTIECPGGIGYLSVAKPNSLFWDYTTTPPANTYVDLATAVQNSGLATYEFYSDQSSGDERARVVFILGGDDGTGNAIDTIQYAVRHLLITDSPSKTPTQTPTTSEPTGVPIKAPTRAPLCEGCTHAPTQSPVAPVPTVNDSSDGMRIKVNAFWMGILVIVLPMIY